MKNHRLPLEVLFPRVRAKVFELLFGATVREHYVRELALRSHLALHTIQDELRKLSALELVTSRPKGSHRYYQANRDHPLYAAIAQIVALSAESPRAQIADLRRPKRSTKKTKGRAAPISSRPTDQSIGERQRECGRLKSVRSRRPSKAIPQFGRVPRRVTTGSEQVNR